MVDLFTTNKDFESIILEEFTGLIFEDEDKVDTSDPQEKLYCFYNLDYSDLIRFIPQYREKYNFEIRDETGKFIEVNKV